MGRNSQARRAAEHRERGRRGPTPPSEGRAPGQERYGFAFGPDPGQDRPDAAETRLGRLLHAAETLPPDSVALLVADELVDHDAAGLDELDVLAPCGCGSRSSPAGSTGGNRLTWSTWSGGSGPGWCRCWPPGSSPRPSSPG